MPANKRAFFVSAVRKKALHRGCSKKVLNRWKRFSSCKRLSADFLGFWKLSHSISHRCACAGKQAHVTGVLNFDDADLHVNLGVLVPFILIGNFVSK